MPYEVSGFCPLSGQFAPNHEQHSHWQQIKPLHKRTFAHHFCKFGTGEDRQIEDAVARWKGPEPGAASRPMVLIDGTRSFFWPHMTRKLVKRYCASLP